MPVRDLIDEVFGSPSKPLSAHGSHRITHSIQPVMALATQTHSIQLQTSGVHGPMRCIFTVFQIEASNTFLQVDSYGLAEWILQGKKSLSLLINRESALQPRDVLAAFNLATKEMH